MTTYTAAQNAEYDRYFESTSEGEEVLTIAEYFDALKPALELNALDVVVNGYDVRAVWHRLNAENRAVLINEAHAQALEADLLHTWQTSDISTACACQAAADKGLFLYAVYRHEWTECGGYVDAHADIKMLPRDGKVQLHLRTSAAPWWQHDSTHIDAESAYACACAIFETTDFVKLEPGHA